jgi:hypothetical protein
MTKSFLALLFIFTLCSCNKKDAELSALMTSNEAMEDVIMDLDDDHERSRRAIEKIYNDRGKRPQEKIILDKADSLRAGTKKIFKAIALIKESLVSASEAAYNKSLSVKEEQSKGLKTNLLAWYKLQDSETAQDFMNVLLNSMSENMSLPLHLINLSNLQWKILKLEKPALEKLMTEIDPDPVGKFKNVKVSVSAYSNVVEEGQEYIAEVIPTCISDSKTFVKEVKMNGQSFPVSSGVGKISFVAKGDKFNKEGLSKKTWRGSVTLHFPLSDTTIAVTKEYFVKKRCAR